MGGEPWCCSSPTPTPPAPSATDEDSSPTPADSAAPSTAPTKSSAAASAGSDAALANQIRAIVCTPGATDFEIVYSLRFLLRRVAGSREVTDVDTTAVREWTRTGFWPRGTDVDETLLALCDALDAARAEVYQLKTDYRWVYVEAAEQQRDHWRARWAEAVDANHLVELTQERDTLRAVVQRLTAHEFVESDNLDPGDECVAYFGPDIPMCGKKRSEHPVINPAEAS